MIAKIDSFIGTLATGSLIQALITMVTDDTPISDAKLSGGFSDIGQTNIGGITLPVFYCAIVALAIWYLLEHTATGRRLYATGFNPDASRLAGVQVDKLRFLSLVTSGGLAGATGIVLASTLGSGSPTAGTPVPAAGVRGRVPRRDPAQERPLQRRRHDHRRPAAGHRHDRPGARRPRRSGRRPCSSASC